MDGIKPIFTPGTHLFLVKLTNQKDAYGLEIHGHIETLHVVSVRPAKGQRPFSRIPAALVKGLGRKMPGPFVCH